MTFDIKKYNQSKFDYYKTVLFYIVVISCLCEVTYFYSDCQIFGRFAKETLIPRFSILIPMVLYILLHNKAKNYKVLTAASLTVLHMAMWCTIWSIYYLPNKDFVREGFIIMHFMFLAVGLCVPRREEAFAHSLVFANILISNNFNHYEHLDMMMSLGIPVAVGLEFVLWVCDNSYKAIYRNELKLCEMNEHDQMTGAFNRNKILTMCNPKTEVLAFDYYSLLIMDIDFFKNVNDTYGHNKGDIVLKELVSNLLKLKEEDDIVVRWGGEEFVLICPNKQVRYAKQLAERIREHMESNPTSICSITLSIGVSGSKEGETYKETVHRADKALYFSKETGRNKVTVDRS